jgi:hypothetical protein
VVLLRYVLYHTSHKLVISKKMHLSSNEESRHIQFSSAAMVPRSWVSWWAGSLIDLEMGMGIGLLRMWRMQTHSSSFAVVPNRLGNRAGYPRRTGGICLFTSKRRYSGSGRGMNYATVCVRTISWVSVNHSMKVTHTGQQGQK